MFTEPFMQRALLAALFLGPLCAFMGVFVTARRMAFFSDTISHAALTGVAVGFWLGLVDPTLPMVVVSLLVAAGIMWLKENTDLLTDTIMALLLSGSVAIGVIILSLLREFRGELHSYLFGEILAIGSQEVWMSAALFAVVGTGLFSRLTPMTLITAHEDMAHVCGVPVRRFNYAFVIVLTLAVALSIRLLGIILVTALIVIPAAAARNVSRNLRQQIGFSILFGFVGSVGGTLLSYQLEDAPCGPMIVLTCVVLFLGSLGFARARVLIVVLALFVMGCDSRREERALIASPSFETVLNLDGKPTNPFAQTNRAIVLVFIGAECPISNRVMPELERLHQKFSRDGVVFWAVYPDVDVSAETIRKHAQEFRYSFAALRDQKHALVTLASARVTPEAAVFDSQKRLVYRGRITDQFVDLGKARQEPTQHDLEDALTALLDGKPISNSVTRAIGCYIPSL